MPASLRGGIPRNQSFTRSSRLHLCQCDICINEVVALSDHFLQGRLLGWNEYKHHQQLTKKNARLAQYDLSPPPMELPHLPSAATPLSTVLDDADCMKKPENAETMDDIERGTSSEPDLDFTLYEVHQLNQIKAILEQSPASSWMDSNPSLRFLQSPTADQAPLSETDPVPELDPEWYGNSQIISHLNWLSNRLDFVERIRQNPDLRSVSRYRLLCRLVSGHILEEQGAITKVIRDVWMAQHKKAVQNPDGIVNPVNVHSYPFLARLNSADGVCTKLPEIPSASPYGTTFITTYNAGLPGCIHGLT
ncbi:hypothetical protein VKT23_015918 [Stygiomarasmius scandens]|uniref:Uncharacterized protein n=1 Tax=Marasmiellus scandens TaxID=2682957 RepID=A0ABR1J0V5_9AGAR